MSVHVSRSEAQLNAAVAAFASGHDALLQALDELAAPIYLTDTDGVVTWFNEACVGFTGRRPAIGKDRWCVTWKLYTEAGDPLPHDRCPMAQAIRGQKPVRGAYAVAERPDRTRVTFTPLPTPLFTADGAFAGAVNMLVDVTELRQAAELESQANWCRQLLRNQSDPRTVATLATMARDYEAKAAELQRRLTELSRGKRRRAKRDASAPQPPAE